MKQRVRAVLITPQHTILAIKRVRPGIPAYWVLSGGGVEDSDESFEAALHREVWEEIAGRAEITGLLHTTEADDERQFFYLARITEWNVDKRSGAEFSQEDRGEYLLEEIPLTKEGFDRIDLKPAEIADEIYRAITDGRLPLCTPAGAYSNSISIHPVRLWGKARAASSGAWGMPSSERGGYWLNSAWPGVLERERTHRCPDGRAQRCRARLRSAERCSKRTP
ncbi:MAG: NUDIX domain-containing protein [Streptomycetaceae bacterium]|nr:NUDIX domain-containing protein [Streptomycetaceae bacterium]